MELVIQLPGHRFSEDIHSSVLAYPDITATANPVQLDLFQLVDSDVLLVQDNVILHLPPFSVTWINIP
jgi:hypothetical protein